MTKFKTLITLGSLCGLTAMATVSCNQNDNKTENNNIVKAQMNKPWKDNFDGKAFETKINKEISRLVDEYNSKNDKKIKKFSLSIQFKSSDAGLTGIQDVDSKKIDFVIASESKYNTYKNKSNLKLGFGTYTYAFKSDLEDKSYTDGTSNDYLIQSANRLNKLFHSVPFKDWMTAKDQTGNTKMGWDSTKFANLYNFNKLVPFYRGMIMIYGDDATLTKIRQAWNDKDWKTFRSFGITHGKPTSGGSFKLPEALLKVHFNKPGNKFTTLALEISNAPDKFKKMEGKFIGSQSDFHIAFDDEASFAWTKNKDNIKPYYTPIKPNEKMEILTLTNSYKYDFGIFRNDFDQLKRSIIAQAFINLAKNKTDTWGPEVGYNGYYKK